jgi:hypothetical protein
MLAATVAARTQSTSAVERLRSVFTAHLQTLLPMTSKGATAHLQTRIALSVAARPDRQEARSLRARHSPNRR